MTEKIVIQECRDFSSMQKQFALLQNLYSKMTFDQYSELLRAICEQKNYFQIVALEGDRRVGVSGIWIGTQLWCGKFLEIDNFVVEPDYRGHGIGKLFMEWIERYAKSEKCAMIRLDAYVGEDKAHRFYFRHGFKVRGFHMTKDM